MQFTFRRLLCELLKTQIVFNYLSQNTQMHKSTHNYVNDLIDYGFGHVLVLDGIPVSILSNTIHARIPGRQIGSFGVTLTAVSQDVYHDKESRSPSRRSYLIFNYFILIMVSLFSGWLLR
jgi:hypothetical protein